MPTDLTSAPSVASYDTYTTEDRTSTTLRQRVRTSDDQDQAVDYVTFTRQPVQGNWRQVSAPMDPLRDGTVISDPFYFEEEEEEEEDSVEHVLAYVVQDFSREDIVRLCKRLRKEIENTNTNIYDEVEE